MRKAFDIKAAYIGAQYRVRLDIPKASIVTFEEPPDFLYERAIKKMESEKEAGQVFHYEIFSDRLADIWKKARAHDIEIRDNLSFTVAAGFPEPHGLAIDLLADKETNIIGYLKFSATEGQLAPWRFSCLNHFVTYRLRALGCKHLHDPASVHLAWIRAQPGGLQCAFPLFVWQPQSSDKKFEIYTLPHGLVGLKIYNVAAYGDDQSIKPLLRSLRAEVESLSETSGYHHEVLVEDVVRSLRAAFRGPERYGYDAPLTLLAAYRTEEDRAFKPVSEKVMTPVKSSAVETAGNLGESEAESGTGNEGEEISAPVARPLDPSVDVLSKYISIEVSEDKLTATIGKFDPAVYDEKIKLSSNLWRDFLSTQSVQYGIDQKYSKPILRVYGEKGSLEGMKVAQGKPPVHAEAPFVYPTFENKVKGSYEPPKGEESGPTGEERVPLYAMKDTLIAEVRFGNIPSDGVAVTGETLPQNDPPEVSINLDETVRREGNYFYAVEPGVPRLVDGALSMQKVIMVDGDLDNSKGPVNFDGNIAVTGNIEEGTVVTVTGDARITGCIYGGQINIGGNLLVEEGIRQGPGSYVKVEGDVTSKFIEASHVECGGNMLIQENILNSTLLAGGNLIVKEGVVNGGEIICGSEMSVFNLGLSRGSLTSVKVGCEIEKEKSLRHKKDRLANLESKEKQWSELIASMKAKDHLTKAEKDIFSDLKKKIKKLPDVIKSARKYMLRMESSIEYDEKAHILVRGTLSSNCRLKIGGVEIPSQDDYEEVEVSAQQKNGTHFHALKPSEDDKKKE